MLCSDLVWKRPSGKQTDARKKRKSHRPWKERILEPDRPRLLAAEPADRDEVCKLLANSGNDAAARLQEPRFLVLVDLPGPGQVRRTNISCGPARISTRTAGRRRPTRTASRKRVRP